MSEVDDLRKALAGANSMIGIRESELELAQGRAAAVERENREMRSLGWLDRALLAETRIADLKHQLGEYADKLDCMVDPEEHRQKLADREAECAELREALKYVQDHGYACNEHGEESVCDAIDTLLSRPTGTQDALRAVCWKVAQEIRCDSYSTPEAIVSRVLGEVANG